MINNETISMWEKSQKLRTLFYLVTPEETKFKRVDDVPDYITQVIPFFVMFLVLEQLILLFCGKFEFRINDAISSLSAGLFSEMNKILIKYSIVTLYIWTYNNFRLIDVQWDSNWAWWICFIGVDLGYYWGHRLSHEINVFWAAHQVHHSSEDYNITTALRQSMIQKYIEGFVYLPLALGVPPTTFIPHLFLNNLSQFWIHTSTVGRLGFIDYIINTPSNHRVHHGRNRYCIDKNYGAVFMIWDHIFGTYESEKEEVVYGLVHPLNSFNPVYIQLCIFLHIWKSFWGAEGFRNKLSVLFKGPGWTPGKPRLGEIDDIPNVSAPVVRYGPSLPMWCQLYALLHFISVIAMYQQFAVNHSKLGKNVIIVFSTFLFVSLISLGALMDKKNYSSFFEIFLRLVQDCIKMDILLHYAQYMAEWTRTFRSMFYLCTPYETSYATIEEVPNYVTQSIPLFFVFTILEQVVLWLQGKPPLRICDGGASIVAGLFHELSKMFVRSMELRMYIWFWNNYKITELPWDSAWTWWLCLLGVDFGYYWFHRLAHEVNIFWAVHSVHHSSEDYNMTTALRLSILHPYLTWMFYMPLALCIPPSIFMVHVQFNLIYQFWIHTTTIGRNRYCIDKNFGGILMIWDIIFGSFQNEEEEVVYGVTTPINTYNPINIQFCHFQHIWKQFWIANGWQNKLRVIFNGPGWAPGKPRLGLIEDIPDVHAPLEKYDPRLPVWLQVYYFIHFVLFVAIYHDFAEKHETECIVLGSWPNSIVQSNI
uniref:Alkylglycerol monooxygenase n=1 Tax=Strigamia maritima TaxID=126957 RepID=T1JG29_STRMM